MRRPEAPRNVIVGNTVGAMTIQDLGALGEIIGALAVVASLVYLAVQIHQNIHQISQSKESTRRNFVRRYPCKAKVT